MPVIEILGLVFGTVGFAGQMMHMLRKRKQYKNSPFVEVEPTRARPNRTGAVAVANVTPYQNDSRLAVQESFHAMAMMRKSCDDVIRLGIREMSNISSRHQEHSLATLQVFQQAHYQHMSQQREYQRQFGYAMAVLAVAVGLLLFLLGYYYSEVSVLRSYKSWGISPELSPLGPSDDDRDDLTLFGALMSLITATIRGYLLIPVTVPFAVLAGIFQLLKSSLVYAVSCVSGVYGSVAHLVSSEQLDPDFNPFAVGLAVIIKMAVWTVVLASLWPANFTFQFLSSLLQVFGIPHLAVHLFLCLVGSVGIVVVLFDAISAAKNPGRHCAKERLLASEIIMWLILSGMGTLFFQSICAMVDGYRLGVYSAIVLCVGAELYASSKCRTCLLICSH